MSCLIVASFLCVISGALTGFFLRSLFCLPLQMFHWAETPALLSILGPWEVPLGSFLPKLLTCPQIISLFAPHNIHVKLRRQIVSPHFTDELLKLNEIKQVAQSDPVRVQ